MRLNFRSRAFHDPWGNKHYNRRASVCRHQYMVGKAELNDFYRGNQGTEQELFNFDATRVINEREGDKFVKGPYSIETIRT